MEQRHPQVGVRMWARSSERVSEIAGLGFSHATTNLELVVSDAELIILAVPVGAMPDLAQRLIAAGVRGDQFVTDVGSVKSLPHETVGGPLKEAGIRFVGSHPMAGSDQSGFSAARPDLFQNAPCILTNDGGLPDEDINRLVAFWSGLGARAAVMSGEEHDQLVARISHVPHVLAAVCALVALKREEDGHFAGGGLRDTSRVAGGEPAMWREILSENKDAVVGPLRESAELMQRLADLIEGGKEDALEAVLEEAQARRRQLD
jgi:prephenate dehydrogenase